LIPPSEEVISPSEHQQVEYIAKPPGELGRLLFSYQLSEQQRQNNWNECRGKWVVWSGTVLGVSPKLKPSKGVFSYDYAVPLLYAAAGEFGVIVDFQPRWTEYLGQLSEGETVHYRAKLVQRKPVLLYEAAKYGISPDAGFLELKDAEIIANDNITAKVVDMVYASYDQLERLVEEAEGINAVQKFFEGKLESGTILRIVMETAFDLANIDISDSYWLLEEEP